MIELIELSEILERLGIDNYTVNLEEKQVILYKESDLEKVRNNQEAQKLGFNFALVNEVKNIGEIISSIKTLFDGRVLSEKSSEVREKENKWQQRVRELEELRRANREDNR